MAGFREGRRRLPQSEPRSRTLPLPATASPASRGRPRGTRVQFARLGRGAAEALVAVHAPARLASVAALAGARVLHPYLRGREPAEKAEEHGERLSPAQPRFFSEEGHSVARDQGVTEGEKRDVARHVRTGEDVLEPYEHQVESHRRPYTERFGIGLVQLEPIPQTQQPDQFLGPVEEGAPGVHERPQVPDKRGKGAEAHHVTHTKVG